MDILNLIKNQDRVDYASNYTYGRTYIGEKLFPSVKTDNLTVRVMQLIEGGDLPVAAVVHSFDSEAKIGDRPNFEIVSLEKMFIKEKINQTERIIQFLGDRASDNEVKAFVYDDMGNMLSRVQTRAEVARMELLSTGKVTIKENNITKEVDYKLSVNNKVPFTWSDPSADIIGDLRTLVATARSKGKILQRAITSAKVLGYIMNNTAIIKMWEKTMDVMTDVSVLRWLSSQFGIEFVLNDEVYKESATSNTTHRFFKEDVISFVSTRLALGESVYGVTPEERELKNSGATVAEKMLVSLTQWKTPDPVAVWTKASALFVPVIKDINGLYIATIS